MLAALIAAGTLAARPLPPDVRRWLARRESCIHFLGEEPYDADRAAFLNRAVARDCPGLARTLRRLRRAHADDPAVLGALPRRWDAALPGDSPRASVSAALIISSS